MLTLLKRKRQFVTNRVMGIAITICVGLLLLSGYLGWRLVAAIKELENFRKDNAEAEKKIALLEQDILNHKDKIGDWEKTKEESLKAAKIAMFESGTEIFKREAKELNEHFVKVKESVVSLHNQVTRHDGKIETVWKSLSSPSEAGQFSEIGLENTLKNYGLEPDRDFIMQYNTKDSDTGGNLRPDAVVKLPGGDVLVIDSKASKFFIELARAEGTDQEERVKEQLKKRMREHVASLASKGYKDSIAAIYKAAGNAETIGNIFTAMYVQSESSLEKLYKIDPEFKSRCEKSGIIPSGPTGLSGLLSLARIEINRARQNKESESIIGELGHLLGGLETVLGHALGVGKGIASAAKSYQKLASSINTTLLPKARRIVKSGVELPKNKTLPANLPSYYVSSDDSQTIDGTSETVAEKKLELEEV